MVQRRVNTKMLLVGSLPAGSAEHAFRAGAELFGDMVFALPDGETGPMAGWVSFEREQLIRPSRGHRRRLRDRVPDRAAAPRL